jgi:hypothetical protein
MNKICSKCNRELPVGAFYQLRKDNPRLMAECKECIIKRVAEHRQTEAGQIARDRYNHSPETIQKRKEYKQSDQGKAVAKAFSQTEKGKAIGQRYGQSEKGKALRERNYLKRCQKQGEKLNRAVRAGVNSSLKGTKNGRKWQELVGYSLQELVEHIERLWLPGMNWDNYGIWHLDHKVPLAAFSFDSPEDPMFRVCWGLANLQPMWGIDNMRKHTKILEPFQPELIVAIDKL